jgi:hypothetical protein
MRVDALVKLISDVVVAAVLGMKERRDVAAVMRSATNSLL